MLRSVRFILFGLTLGIALPCIPGCGEGTSDEEANQDEPVMDNVPEVTE